MSDRVEIDDIHELIDEKKKLRKYWLIPFGIIVLGAIIFLILSVRNDWIKDYAVALAHGLSFLIAAYPGKEVLNYTVIIWNLRWSMKKIIELADDHPQKIKAINYFDNIRLSGGDSNERN